MTATAGRAEHGRDALKERDAKRRGVDNHITKSEC